MKNSVSTANKYVEEALLIPNEECVETSSCFCSKYDSYSFETYSSELEIVNLKTFNSYRLDFYINRIIKCTTNIQLLKEILNYIFNNSEKDIYNDYLSKLKHILLHEVKTLEEFCKDSEYLNNSSKEELDKLKETSNLFMKNPKKFDINNIISNFTFHDHFLKLIIDLLKNYLYDDKNHQKIKNIFNIMEKYFEKRKNIWREKFNLKLDNFCKNLKLNNYEKRIISLYISGAPDDFISLIYNKNNCKNLIKMGFYAQNNISYDNYYWIRDYFRKDNFNKYNSISDYVMGKESYEINSTIKDDDYPEEIQNKINDIKTLIKNHKGSTSLNILLWGKSGSGKTTMVELLQSQLTNKKFIYIQDELLNNSKMYRNRLANEQNNYDSLTETKASLRLKQLKICDYLSYSNDCVFIMDEADDSLNSSYGLSDHWLTGKKEINELLEKLKTPVIWIINHKNNIDESTCRRFQYSIKFDKLTVKQREKVWQKQIQITKTKKILNNLNLNEIITKYDLTPGIIANILNNLKILNPEKSKVKDTLIKLINNHLDLINEKEIKDERQSNNDNYNIDGLNIKSQFSLDKIVPSLQKFLTKLNNNETKNKNICILLSGFPGTGKTEFAKYIARELDKKLIYNVYGDLANCFVGETEHNIRDAFTRAENEDAILFFDEADSLIFSRDKAQVSWESSATNEVLTRMERFKGIFIASTNFLDNIDSAAMRRFQLKINFDYLNNDGKEKFFQRFFNNEINNKERLFKINQLTPGDFKAVRDKLELFEENISEEMILNELEMEVKYKKANVMIGF